jgi:hypothetical protein
MCPSIPRAISGNIPATPPAWPNRLICPHNGVFGNVSGKNGKNSGNKNGKNGNRFTHATKTL